MIKSMTGFGRGTSQHENKSFAVEIKTVNHRFSDVFVKMPRHLSFLEDKVRELIVKNITRGKVDVFITYESTGEDSKVVTIDESLVSAYLKSLNILKEKYYLIDDMTVSSISRMPDVLRIEKAGEDEEQLSKLLSEAVEKAVESLVDMRIIEGEKLKIDLLERVELIIQTVNQIELRAPEVVSEYKIKLENRIKELLEQKIVDENRLAMEVAIFADRCSIDEELVRLKSHFDQIKTALEMTQSVGRKLDFLVQEMNREINTIGSKANDLVITRHVVDVKSEMEKIREQIQNIE